MANTLSNTMSAVRFQQGMIVNTARLLQILVPQFSPDQLAALQRDPKAAIHSLDQKAWVGLMGWLNEPATAVVQWRRAGLTVQINRRANMAATLLASAANFPVGTLFYKDTTGAQQQKVLHTAVDADKGLLTMQLPFDAKLSDEVFTAMTAPNSDASVSIDYSHPIQTKVPAPTTTTTTPKPKKSGTVRVNTGLNTKTIKMVQMRPAVRLAAFQPAAAPAAVPMARAAVPARPIAVDRTLLINRNLEIGRIFIPTKTVQGDVIADHVFSGRVTIPLPHDKADTKVFNLPPQARSGWDQVPGNPKLHFRDSAKMETYFYLPTTFRVGYYFEAGADGAGKLAPLRIELYRDPKGDERIKATLVALPCIEDAEKRAIRTYIQDDVLQRLQPFVNLEPKTGIKAEFKEEFTSGNSGDQRNLPVEIKLLEPDAVLDDRLKLQFDMPADKYSIFCDLLKFGIFGRVTITEDAFQTAVSVRLQLEDMTTNLLKIEQVAAPPPAQPDAPVDPPTLTVSNLLEYPVQVPSLDVHLLDKGDASGMIFDAESLKLLPTGGQLAPQAADASAFSFPLKAQRLVAWDTSLVDPGQVKVLGGTADEWLTRVNRDPSLQPHQFRIQLQLAIPPSIQDRVQLVRLALFKDGERAVRSKMDVTAGGDAKSLVVIMTLAELMGTGGKAPSFSVEYETLASDGTLSPAQRVVVSPDVGTLVLRAMLPTALTIFTVEFEGDSGTVRRDVSREELDKLIAQLQNDQKHWEVFGREPTTTTTTSAPVSTATTTTTAAPVTAEVVIVTDLVAIAFENKTLKRVFVVLQADKDGAAEGSFFFDATNHAQMTWKPSGVAIPPFRYQVTYLYMGNQVKEVSGTSSNLTLILDPPALPPG